MSDTNKPTTKPAPRPAGNTARPAVMVDAETFGNVTQALLTMTQLLPRLSDQMAELGAGMEKMLEAQLNINADVSRLAHKIDPNGSLQSALNRAGAGAPNVSFVADKRERA